MTAFAGIREPSIARPESSAISCSGGCRSPKWRSRPAPRDDVEWHSFVALVIAPHPDLTPSQSRAIAIDYGIRGGSTSIKVRRALLFYALKRLGLDVPPGTRPAHEQHIVLVNRAEVDAAQGRPVEG
jgi:hypothetical protein